MGSQEQKILERFGRTAGVFSDFVLSERAQDMRQVVAWAKPERASLVLDVACGPGTLALAFAGSVAGPDSIGAGVVGLDLTPEMLLRARQEAEASRPALGDRCWFCRGRAETLPFADAKFDIVSCAYSFHHLAAPERVLEEMLRVTKPGGRAIVVDLIAPEEDDRAARNNQIEQLRDASHTRTLKLSEICRLCDRGGAAPEWFLFDRDRDFEGWMAVAGVKAGTPVYDECYELMWRSMDSDAAGFRPRWEGHRLHYIQHSVAVATCKQP